MYRQGVEPAAPRLASPLDDDPSLLHVHVFRATAFNHNCQPNHENVLFRREVASVLPASNTETKNYNNLIDRHSVAGRVLGLAVPSTKLRLILHHQEGPKGRGGSRPAN